MPFSDSRMEYDDVAWEKDEGLYESWAEKVFEQEMLREIGLFILDYREGLPEELFPPKMGSFNILFRMKFRDGESILIRFPRTSSRFPEEKIKCEVAVMRFLEYHTSIRVPHVHHYGMTEQSPGKLGPFIIMDYFDCDHTLTPGLNTPSLSIEDRPILDPNISEERLTSCYSQMADILLELSKHDFNEIGCIKKENEEDKFDDSWIVAHRPWTFNMNELIQMGNFPPDHLPPNTFKTASSYYLALAEMHMLHLSTQHNDCVNSLADCRRKYIARCLFRRLAREGRLHDPRFENGPFRLFCDDFRPANVLSNKDFQIIAAIDWEYCYAAPSEFTYSPPFWLLLELPEYWPEGLEDWTKTYEKRLSTFLRAMELQEEAKIGRGVLKEHERLSAQMRRSWQSGDFWVNYAARKSWAFDMIYWAKIDRRFYGEGDMDDRLSLLTPTERAGMDAFVARKMDESRERVLIDWTKTDSKDFVVP